MSISAVIFDMDGVITDTEPVHLSSWRYVLKREGISISDEDYKQLYLGLNDQDFITALGKNKGKSFSELDKKQLIRNKLQRSLTLLKTETKKISGIDQIVKALSEKFPLAICSGSIRQEVQFILKTFNWDRLFYPVVTGEDVTQGKPHPHGYLLTLSKLKQKNSSLNEQSCLVIEDSPKGVAAAKAAGMRCLALTSNHYTEKELNEADWKTNSLTKIPADLKLLLNLNGNF